MAKVSVYKVSKEEEKINALGEQGWEIVLKSPLIIGKAFDMPKDAPILDQFRKWLSIRINTSANERKFLKKEGYSMRRIYVDEIGDRAYILEEEKEGCPLFQWRFEFNYTDDEPIAYITFGSIEMNTPAFAKKEVIEKYVPKEILESALASGSLVEAEIETEGSKNGN